MNRPSPPVYWSELKTSAGSAVVLPRVSTTVAAVSKVTAEIRILCSSTKVPNFSTTPDAKSVILPNLPIDPPSSRSSMDVDESMTKSMSMIGWQRGVVVGVVVGVVICDVVAVVVVSVVVGVVRHGIKYTVDTTASTGSAMYMDDGAVAVAVAVAVADESSSSPLPPLPPELPELPDPTMLIAVVVVGAHPSKTPWPSRPSKLSASIR